MHSLLKRYRNPVYLLTSYNANPRATRRWKENISSRDILSFIERIPYQETKSYVKLVMRNYFYYKRWYGEKEEKLPLFDELLLLNRMLQALRGALTIITTFQDSKVLERIYPDEL